MKNRLIGMRTIKTAIVVIIAYFVSSVVNDALSFSLIYAAVIGIETSVVSSVKIGYNRVLGTVVGGIIGLIVSYLPIYGGFTMALGIFSVIIFCNYLDIKKATGIAITLVIIIITAPADTSPALYSAQRTLDTIIGIGLATIVNILIYPPDQMKRLGESFSRFKALMKNVVSDVVIFSMDDSLKSLDVSLTDLKEKFSHVAKELSILRKYEKEEYEYYMQMIEACEKVFIYTEAISLSESGVRMTMDNYQKLSKILLLEIETSDFVTMANSTREDMIYNYNLAKLIAAMEKVLREKTFSADQMKY